MTLPQAVTGGGRAQIGHVAADPGGQPLGSGANPAGTISGTSASYHLGGLVSGRYRLEIRVDTDGNGAVGEPGDYEGYYDGALPGSARRGSAPDRQTSKIADRRQLQMVASTSTHLPLVQTASMPQSGPFAASQASPTLATVTHLPIFPARSREPADPGARREWHGRRLSPLRVMRGPGE